jgi:hypothetical protein
MQGDELTDVASAQHRSAQDDGRKLALPKSSLVTYIRLAILSSVRRVRRAFFHRLAT